MRPITIHARRRGRALLGTLVLVVASTSAALHEARTLAFLLVALAVVAEYLIRRPRLSADAGGLTVVNLVRTTRIPWGDVAGTGAP
jgi:hypothetical protein